MTLRFAPFAVDVQRHRLTRGGEPVDLSPRLVEILGHLAANAGQVVSRESLLERFWTDIEVTDSTVTWSLNKIRKALGDEAANPTFIQTVARRGYRFVAAVDASHAPTTPDTFDAWMKGRLSLEALDAGQLDAAARAFEQVLAADDTYAPAHTALANACFLAYERTRPDPVPDQALRDRALAHARRACVLDPASGEAWATLGFVLTSVGDVEGARAAARRSTALQPSSWRHQFRLSVACWGQERLDAVDRTLALLPDFAPARLVAAMVFVARQAFAAAEPLVVQGAACQSHDACHESAFPAFGLHWLLGLLQLRHGEVGKALASFDREVADARPTSIYVREDAVNASIGAGYAHLTAGDAAGARAAFHRALDGAPGNGRALLGLQQACARDGSAADAAALAARVDDRVRQLKNQGRSAEAAMLSASAAVARGECDAACATLERLLLAAPPGQAGWLMPLDPALVSLRQHPSFERVLALLSARAR